MSLGLCCQYIEEIKKKSGKIEYKNILDERHLQFSKFNKNDYSNEHIKNAWINNVKNLFSVLKRIHEEGFRSFRVSSGLIPLYDLVPDLLSSSTEVHDMLSEIGEFAKANQIRLTQHPDQFCVLSSNNPDVIKKSVIILNHHSWVFDKMNLDHSPYYAINVHGGTKNNQEILIQTINSLPQNTKSRLTLENDERSYSVNDLFHVYEKTNVPIVYDTHHASFNLGKETLQSGFDLAKQTWGNIKQLTHLSNTTPGLENGNFTERRKHSDFIHNVPEFQRLANNNDECDIDIEAKMKNFAIIKMTKDFDIKL